VVLRRMLVVARKRGRIEYVPDFEWLEAPLPDFDFLDFESASPGSDDRHSTATRRPKI
jgi:hypothetical protein